VSCLLADASIGVRTTGLLALIETPESMGTYLLRAQGQDDAKRRAQGCITAVKKAFHLAQPGIDSCDWPAGRSPGGELLSVVIAHRSSFV
jgi:hypothetical protein